MVRTRSGTVAQHEPVQTRCHCRSRYPPTERYRLRTSGQKACIVEGVEQRWVIQIAQACLPGTLADAMRPALCAEGALAVHFSRVSLVSLQAFLFACPLLRARAASPLLAPKAPKKAQSHHTPVTLGNGRPRLQYSVDSVQIRFQVLASAYRMRIAEATPYPLPSGSQLWQDLGFLPFMSSNRLSAL
jgi:hypothetical protein